jgi:hypothetical protein
VKTISPLLFPLTRITCKRVDAEGGTIWIGRASWQRKALCCAFR